MSPGFHDSVTSKQPVSYKGYTALTPSTTFHSTILWALCSLDGYSINKNILIPECVPDNVWQSGVVAMSSPP